MHGRFVEGTNHNYEVQRLGTLSEILKQALVSDELLKANTILQNSCAKHAKPN